MEVKLATGLKGERELIVTLETSALKIGSGGLEVLATPAMVALMEGAAFNLVQELLPEGYSTVGTKVEVEHLAATPLGMKVTATAKLLEVEGKKLGFGVEVRDEKELVGRGYHERFIIQTDRFLSKVQGKLE